MMQVIKKIAFLIFFLFPLYVFASKSNIVAVVNDSPITKYEFEARKKLAIVIFKVDTSAPGVEHQLNRDILNSLIEGEVLKQHAEKVGGKITDEEIDQTIEILEKQNKMPKGGLIQYLKANDVSIKSFRDQLVNERIKYNIINSLSNSVNISQKEIETAFLLNANKDFEIEVWVFSSKNNDADAHKKMTKLQSSIKSCDKINNKNFADFADAEKFDRHLKQLDDKIQSIIQDTKIGNASTVFQDQGKFKFVFVCKKHALNVSENEAGQVKYFLTNQKTTKKAEKFLSDLKRKAYVKVLDPSFGL